eukprot:943075-Pelagomonas_calceolata.AAC.1
MRAHKMLDGNGKPLSLPPLLLRFLTTCSSTDGNEQKYGFGGGKVTGVVARGIQDPANHHHLKYGDPSGLI